MTAKKAKVLDGKEGPADGSQYLLELTTDEEFRYPGASHAINMEMVGVLVVKVGTTLDADGNKQVDPIAFYPWHIVKRLRWI